MRYDRFTRLLHALLAFGVSTQLVLSLVMDNDARGGPAHWFFRTHETLGLALLGVLVLHWAWSLRDWRAHGLALFPWFSRARLRALGEDLRLHLRGKAAPTAALAPAVHGLGLLAATALAATGAAWFAGLGAAKDVHEALGTLMWGYLGGHAGMAMWHEWRGRRLLRRTFNVTTTE